ncbi:carbohydrate ABC transporter permease [Parablautia intestinalis]|uniref:carbohydrate ABC transporter permease n=1 Tax=Parablautia intestinalis TaxID=2320100 RepID=UPI0023D2CECC|nr:carbohydrate ABC transporter permease [Parablautia intestinalis]MDE7047306.1 carbohydrate ABC transporter permease [Lachnospiraceae bacterium]
MAFKKEKTEEQSHYYAGQKKGLWWKYLLAVIIILIYLLPLYVLLMQSFKSSTDLSSSMSVPDVWYFENYLSTIKDGTIFRAIKNSAFITLCTVTLEVIFACLAAYPLSRNDSKGNRLIRSIFMGVMMIPPLTILVGVYSVLVSITATNSYWGIILTNVAFGLPMAVFLFTNFIGSIPRDLDEASIIDGANVLQTFFHIILPQLKPIIATVVILHGVAAWNEYAYSIYILQKPELQSITLCIKKYFSSVTNDYSGAAAAAILAILPLTIIYLILQDAFVQSQVDSAIK